MYDEIVPFFGTEKAKLFVALNYTNGDDYSNALNEGNAEALLDEPLWQLMSAKNYINGGRTRQQPTVRGATGGAPGVAPGVAPVDLQEFEVAGQFIDFIKSIARHHAQLDGLTPKGDTEMKAAELASTGLAPVSRSDIGMKKQRSVNTTGINQSSEESDKLYRQIYTNWERLDESTRQFYSQHLNVLDSLRNVVQQQTPGEKARLNLLKTDPGDNMSTVVFQQTLPLLPKGAVMVAEQPLVPVAPVDPVQKLDQDFLRKEYRKQYLAERGAASRVAYQGGGAMEEYFKAWASSTTNPNGLDVAKFTAALVYVTNKKVKATSTGDVKGDFDSVYDLVTGNLYTVGSNGELLKDGKTVDAKSYAEDIANNKVKCFGTNLADCDNVYECLLSGDPKKLGRCLGKLRNADMKQVAGKEFKDIRPEAALELLKTFNIELRKDQYGNRVPMEFLEWRATLDARVGQSAAAAIKGNKQLLAYLRGVVELVRLNPNIIAENRNKEVSSRLNPANTGGITINKPRPFIAPSKRAAPASTMLLRTIPFVTNQLSLPTPPLLPPGIAGFGYGPTMSFPFGFMRGGDGDKNELTDLALGLKKNYDTVLRDLQDSGKDLVDTDKQLIENAIHKVSKNHKQIVHLLNELAAFNRLSTVIKAGLPRVIGASDFEGASRMVNLDKTVDNLQSNVGSIARENQALITQLYNNVFKSLASLRLGVSSSNLIPVGH